MANAAAALLAGYLPGTNPYTFLRAALRETGSPVKPEWFFDLLYVLSAAFALLTLLSIFGLVLRIRQRTLWFARWVVVPSGRLLMYAIWRPEDAQSSPRPRRLHPINCNAMAKFIFFAVVQIYLWRVSWAFHRTGDGAHLPTPCRGDDSGTDRAYGPTRPRHPHARDLDTLSPRRLVGCVSRSERAHGSSRGPDMAGTVAGVIVAAFRKTGKSPRLFSVWPVHLFLYATPLLGIALLVIAFAYLGVSVSRLDAALDTIVQSLVAGEASWTPDEPLAQLLALAPEADAFSAASDATKLACRSVYIVYSCILVAMLAVRPMRLRQGDPRSGLRRAPYPPMSIRPARSSSRCAPYAILSSTTPPIASPRTTPPPPPPGAATTLSVARPIASFGSASGASSRSTFTPYVASPSPVSVPCSSCR
jgi:hypothetical protein